jgi:hypothetical protein
MVFFHFLVPWSFFDYLLQYLSLHIQRYLCIICHLS